MTKYKPIIPLKGSGKEDFSDFTFSPEGGRACWMYSHFYCTHQFVREHKEWGHTTRLMGHSKNHLIKWYFVYKDTKDFEIYLNRFLKDLNKIQELEDHITKTREEAVKDINIDNINKKTDKELAEILMRFYQGFDDVMMAAGNLRSIDRAMIPALKKLFKDDKNQDEKIAISSSPHKLSFSAAEELEILELAVKIEKIGKIDDKMKKELQRIHDSYCWGILGYYVEKQKTLSDYENQIMEIIKQDPFTLLKNFKNKIEKEKKEHEHLAKNLDENGRKLLKVASAATYLKDYFKSSINKVEYFGEIIFEEVGRRTGKGSDYIKDLLPWEAESLLLNKEDVDQDLLRERTRNNVIAPIGDKFYMFVGEAADEFESKYLKIKQNNDKEFKGRIACLGHAKGKAKVILGTKDFHKLEKGDILVVTNTSPDFVTIMKKAGAIIAEEGGLTAHVSVVSREFGIPCIVGLSHITQNIKDNDLIEVDANNGLVKILNKQ